MQSVQIVEVAPRDGLQNEAAVLSTEAKLALIEHLAATGVRRIEATSFVNPARVPQLADAEALCARLPRGSVSWIGLVLNERGLDRAIRAAVDEVNVVVVATDTFSQRNQGATVSESIAAWSRIATRARAAGLRTTVTVAAAFGCPFEGEVAPERVADVLGPLRAGAARRGRAGRHHRRRRAGRGPGARRRRGHRRGRAFRCAGTSTTPATRATPMRSPRSSAAPRRSTRARAVSAAARSPPPPPATSPPRTCSICCTGPACRPA